jgi:hypothetical protein
MSTPSMLYGCIADAEMPYFACFRKPTSTSLVLTYPCPAFYNHHRDGRQRLGLFSPQLL